ncbi:hypothetical protein EV426DRAFT_715912 [Tirmania nivea]|nr:hypothetical protein EV426DRAFT_715912 [Tirmania nivea]
MHKGFKDAYRRSNKVDATAQIITTYTRDHTFAMKDLAIHTWSHIRELKEPIQGISINPGEGQVYLKLQGKIDLETVSNLEDLERMAGLSNLKLATRGFLIRELKGADSDAVRLLDRDIWAYYALQIPVPNFSGQGFVMHIAVCTEEKGFRGQRRNDWIWVRRHVASGMGQSNSLNGRIPGRLNMLFKLKSKERKWSLAMGAEAVRIGWVKAHVGIPGNERADELAKAGAEKLYPSDLVITEGGLKQQWRRWMEAERKVAGTGGGRVVRRGRKARVNYVHCRTGKGNLQARRAKLDDTVDPTCQTCGRHVETSRHVALVCPRGEEIGQRWDNWEEMDERKEWIKKIKDGGEEYTVDLFFPNLDLS